MRTRAFVRWIAVVCVLSTIPMAHGADVAIVVSDETGLRAAAKDSAKPHTLLWQGEALEVRGAHLDFVQVYDHRLERGGFVKARDVRVMPSQPESAGDLLAVVRFLRETPGAESLGIAYAAAFLRAAPAARVQGAEGAEALDAIGTFAERLARRATTGVAKPSQAALSGHLDVAQQYGIAFSTQERGGRVAFCYDGDAFLRVLRMSAADATQKAGAALALTRLDCRPSELRPTERRSVDEAGAELLEALDLGALSVEMRNRIHMRRASLWASLAYQKTRRGEDAQEAGARALEELARIRSEALTDEDARAYADAAMRVNASRWSAVKLQDRAIRDGPRPWLDIKSGEPGETCVALVNASRGVANPLARRCTYGIVWEASATMNREGNAAAIAVQHTDTWREIWILRKAGADWTVKVVPPAPVAPGIGYAEFAGWVPGGKQMLVAREALGDGKYTRGYELMRLDSLAVIAKAPEPAQLPAFERWQDAGWKRSTVSLR